MTSHLSLRLVAAAGLAGWLAACSPSAPRPDCRNEPPLGSLCGFENPEDLAYLPSARALLSSNMRLLGRGGFLSAMRIGGAPARVWPTSATGALTSSPGIGDDACPPPDPAAFAPHGIFLDQRDAAAVRLYAVNHGDRESIEIFAVESGAELPSLRWLACVVLPPATSANDVAVAPDGEIVASNYLPSPRAVWGTVKYVLGWNTGDMLAWRRDTGWRHLPGTAASGANGVAISGDGRWVYYAATGAGTINKVPRDGSAPPVAAEVPGLPDNLSWTARGTLLLPTHESITGFIACLRSAPCRGPWRLLEVEPDSLRVVERFRHDGTVVGAVAAAEEIEGRTYLSAVFGDRIGVLHQVGGP